MDSKFNLNFSLCPTSINFDERINTDYSQSSFNDIEMTDHMDNIIIDENNNKLLSHCFCGNNEDSLKMIGCEKCSEWFHCECVGIKKFLLDHINNYYCHLCRASDSSLKLTFFGKKPKLTEAELNRFKKQNSEREAKETSLFKLPKRQKYPINNIDNSPNSKFYSKILTQGFDPIHLKAAVAIKNEEEIISSKVSVSKNNNNNKIEQCQGPSCVNVALENSKYCSHECGLQLAAKRMQLILPERYTQYTQTEIDADHLNKYEIKRINEEITSLNEKISQVDQKLVDLDLKIEKNKKIKPLLKQVIKNSMDLSCVNCDKSINEKNALEHIEECIDKSEMESYYGSPYKHDELYDSLICGVYNPEIQLYCRRLKLRCPEHRTNDKNNNKNDDNQICGCFGLFENKNDSDQFCLVSKSTCTLHFKWELKRKAQFHLEKLQLINRLEELLEEKSINETAIKERKNVLNLLLNQTIYNN